MKGLQESLQRLATHNMVKKVLSTVAQWERHAIRFCAWKLATMGAKSETDLGLGWWELPEHENYPVGVADATAAMIHAIQFGGAMEFGGSIRDLTLFVREYVQGCRLTCAIKRYTHEERKEKNLCQQLLRNAFEEAEDSRANFEEQARVISSKLPKKHAEGRTFDALHILALQRAKSFDLHMENCRQISEGWLALQNVHSYQAMSRLYPRLAAIEKEMEDTIRSMTELTNPGAEAPETDVIEEEEPKKDEHPKRRAQRRRETMRKRRQAMEKKMSSVPESSQSLSGASRPQISFEDKEAHEAQLADLKKRFKKISDDVELNLDAGDRSRLQHLFALLSQGQQKMEEAVDGLAKIEADATRYELTVSEKLRSKYEKWAMESLKRGRVPTEMDPGALRRGSGPTPQERDDLRRKNTNLRMDIEERLMVTEEEKELQEELDEVLEKLQEIHSADPEGEDSAALAGSTVVEEDALSFPTLIPVLKALDQSVRHGSAAQEMAFMEFVQLTTSSAKLERKAKNLGQTISKLLEGQITGKPDAQEAEWQAACKDLILDMEQVFDQIKVSGLPKNIVDKFWQEKQLEIRAAQQSAFEDSNDKRAKKAQRENKKMEIKLEASIQEQENKKKQLLLGIEALWARAQAQGDDKQPQASPRAARATVVMPSAAALAAPVGRQTVTRASMLGGPAGAVMERILQSHRADIANGHQRRKDILEDIRKLQEKIKELEPPEKPPHRDSAADPADSAADPADADSAATDAAASADSAAAAATDSAERADAGEASEELTVDWLGLNSRIGKDKDNPDASSSPGASGRSTPSGAPLPGGGAHEGGETIEEESSSSSSEEERPVLQMDPWILAFPFDPPDLAKRKFEFCQQHRIKSHRLHDLGKQKKYQFLLRRHIKQEKRTLMLKQKLLLKFLTGDELQRAKNEMKKGPADLKAEAEVERGKLKDRQMMIAKLLMFWQRRMKSLEEDQEAEREAFRMKVKALLVDIHSLAVVLESAAMTKKRRRRVDAEDLLRRRRQKAEEAARQQVEEERESMNTTQALKAARETEGQGSMTALQKMAAFARNIQHSGERMQEDDAVERMRLAKMLRTFMDQNKTRDDADDDAGPAPLRGLPPRALRRPSIGRRPSGRRSTETLDDDLQISATHFHRQGSPRNPVGGDEEVPTQTLSLEGGPGDKTKSSSSLRRGFGLTSSPSRKGRVTAKRKPSVAQRDSIFANPAAMSRRISGDAAAMRTATIEVTLAGGVSSGEPTKTLTPAVLPTLPIAARVEEENDAGTASQPTSLVAETWSLGDVPNRPITTTFGGLKGSLALKPKGKADTGRLLRPSSRSSSPEGLRRPSTVRKSTSRPSDKLQHASSQVNLLVGAEKRNSFMQGGLQTPDPRQGGKSPGSPESPEDASGPPSRRGSEREVDQEEVRAEMFLKATYLHLGGVRAKAMHPALRTQKAALSDALFCADGERLFRRLVAQVMDLAPEMALKVVRNILNTERGRCLFIIKNSLIHQARLELEASQRVIHILEQEPDEVQRQLAEGGPLFPLSGKPPSDTSGTSSSSEEDEGDASSTFPKRTSTDNVEPSSPTSPSRVKSRRAGMRGFVAFSSSIARSAARRPTAVLGEGEVEEAPLLQIRSAENNVLQMPVSKPDDARPGSAARKRGSKSVGRTQYLAPANMAERLREAQLAADAQGARHGSQVASEKGNPTTVFTNSLASSMLKTMLKKNAPAPAVKVKTSMSLVGDYAWDKVVKKFESNLAKHNFTPDLAAGQWKSHFAWDLLHDDPLSGRLPDRPLTAPPPQVKHLPPHQRRSIWSTAVARHTVAACEASTTAAEGEQDENKPTSAPMLFALAKFMSRMRNKKPSQVDNFFYLNAVKEKWQQRSSRLKLLTEDMEKEYRHVRQKLIEEKGIWLQKSRKKVEQMQLHLEEDLDPTGGFDRQKRNLRERGALQQEQRGFDSLSFVRWKVDKQLKQAMQEAERGSRVGPVTRERTAGPPPHEPVWIAGDKRRYNSNLEASKQRIAALRAKKSKDPRFVKQGRGRAWLVALNVFEYLDEKIAHPEDFAEDSESETDSQSPNSRSQSITRFTPEPGHFRRSRRRRSGGASKQGRELSILSPWMRSEFMSDEEYDLRPDTWDLRCWLQPVRHRARTATDRVFTPEHHWKALSRKGSRSDPGQRLPEDPVLLVQQACRKLAEDFVQEDPPAPDVKIVVRDPNADAANASAESPAVMDDFDAKHSKVLEILQQDSLLNQEPLDSVIEEDEEDSGSAGEPGTKDPSPPSPKKRKKHKARAGNLGDTLPGHNVSPRKVEMVKSVPVLSMQTLTFQLESPASRQKTAISTRGDAPGMSASASAPSLQSDSSKESLHAAQPRHGQPLSLHAMRTAAARRGTGAQGAHRRRSSARYQMFDVVARPLQDLRKLQSLRRRSLVRPEASEASEAASCATSRRTTEVGATPGHPAGPPARQMTVNIDKLSKELAKRWTNVTSQEVEHRRMEMEKLKEEDGDVNLDSFFEYDVMRTASNHSEGHGGHTAVPGSQVDQRMASRRRSKGAQMSEAAAAAQLKVQKHLAQLRNWHSTGRAPTSPVPLPVLVPKEASKVTESKAKELRKEKSLRTPGAAKEDGQEMPMSAVNSADQYMKGGFKDADLNRLLEQISQTDTFPEGGEDFVWAPPSAAPRKVPLPQLSRGESWIKAIVRGDSPYLDLSGQEAPKPRRGRSPEEAGVS